MKTFKCRNCRLLLFFENSHCGSCNRTLGYLPQENELHALQADGSGLWYTPADSATAYRFCDNAAHGACNWLLPADSAERFCVACRHNRTIPDLTDTENLINWRKLEFAKHRMFYTLLRLGLPLANRAEDPDYGLAFDFLADEVGGKRTITGHDDGIITLALKEADDAEREKRRTFMHEPYRTLLGHFRHEIGHYYWDRLVADRQREEASRTMFGDDREDYGEALKRHYDSGPPADWQNRFVSTYASSHAWEDFAETWAHYMHIVDCLETAAAYGMEVHPSVTSEGIAHCKADIDPYADVPFDRLIEQWLPLTYAMNAMNRSMGLSDIYPFVLTPPVMAKLGFIHRLVHDKVD